MNISCFPNLQYWLPLLENLGIVKLSCLKHNVRDFLFTLFLVEILWQRQTNSTSFFFHYCCCCFFFQFLALFSVCCFTLKKHFCKSSNTYGSSTHFTHIWHAEKTEVVTVPFQKKHLLNYFLNLLYLKLWSENIFKTRLVSSEKYKPSFFHNLIS